MCIILLICLKNGFITSSDVIKDIGLKEPYIGISPLTSGEIADDFAHYFLNSEQTTSAVVDLFIDEIYTTIITHTD